MMTKKEGEEYIIEGFVPNGCAIEMEGLVFDVLRDVVSIALYFLQAMK